MFSSDSEFDTGLEIHQLKFPRGSLKLFLSNVKFGRFELPLKYCDPLKEREQTLYARFATPNVDNPAGGVRREIDDNVQSRTPYVGVAED